MKADSCQTHKKPTADSRLHNLAKRTLRQTLFRRLYLLLPELPQSEVNFNLIRTARMAHSYSQGEGH
jgi:hypothetical protein